MVIAGPSCCGKTTFVARLMADQVVDLAGSLQLLKSASQPWTYKDLFLHEDEILSLIESGEANVILHYTLPYPSIKFWIRPGYDKRVRLAILGASDHITVVTLFACRASLLRRVGHRKVRIFQKLEQGQISRWKAYRLLRTLNHLERIYASKDQLKMLYEGWFAHLRHTGVHEHHLFDVTDVPRLMNDAEWDAVVSSWDAPVRSSTATGEISSPGADSLGTHKL